MSYGVAIFNFEDCELVLTEWDERPPLFSIKKTFLFFFWIIIKLNFICIKLTKQQQQQQFQFKLNVI